MELGGRCDIQDDNALNIRWLTNFLLDELSRLSVHKLLDTNTVPPP
jgi:hypothetical protein